MDKRLHLKYPIITAAIAIICLTDHRSLGRSATGLGYSSPCGTSQTYIEKDYVLCGERYCRCKDDIADCSGHYGKLNYVPALPDGITRLYFASNSLYAMRCDQRDFFVNVTGIFYLDLSGNGLSFICPGSFTFLVNLRDLRLQANKLTIVTLSPVFSLFWLTLLDVSDNPLGDFPDRLFHNYTMPRLEWLCLEHAGMTSLNMSVFTSVPRLSFITLANNYLSEKTLTPAFLPRLNTLVLAANPFQRMASTCDDNGLPFFPNLTSLDLSYSPVTVDGISSSDLCAPRLDMLTLKKTFVSYIPTNAFGQHLFPSLQTLTISDALTIGITHIDRYAFNNSKLQDLVLSVAVVNFGEDSIHPDCFAGCSNLENLILDGNNVGSVSQQKLLRLFNNRHLAYLTCGNCNIASVKAEMFVNLPNLTCISMDSNKITDVPGGVFDGLSQLVMLDLSSNRIARIRESTFSAALQRRLEFLNLGNNPFQCDCELRWFQHWLTFKAEIFHDYFESYMCDNLPNTTVQSFVVADQACLWSPAVSKFIIASILLLLLPLLTGVMLYRYRWHIRLLMYEAARGGVDSWRRLKHQHFRYDVFVSYDSWDLEWVRNSLMPELEGRQKLHLCIHQRNFTPGAPIVENIEESVQTSKTIMLLFSRNFARSHWCQFELQLCLTHVLEHGDALLVVLLEDIPSRDLTPAMMAVMKTMTYIEWGEGPDARASFWGRIRLALNPLLLTAPSAQLRGGRCEQ